MGLSHTQDTTEELAMSEVRKNPYSVPPPEMEPQRIKISCLEYGETQSPKSELCPTCDITVWTNVTTSTTTFGYVWFLLCYCFCCACSLLPFYLNRFKIYEHFCPKCGALLKTVSPTFSRALIVMFVLLCVLLFTSILFFWSTYMGFTPYYLRRFMRNFMG